MTASPQPTPAELLASWVTTDTLIARLQHRLTENGTPWEDLDQRLADELGVTLREWFDYHAVCRAADTYQTSRWHNIPPPTSPSATLTPPPPPTRSSREFR